MFTVQVPVDAFVAQENEPDGAAEQVTTEGLAAVPAAAHFVLVRYSGEVVEVVASKVPGAMNVDGTESVHEPLPVIGVDPVTVTWFAVPASPTLVTVPPPPLPPALAQVELWQVQMSPEPITICAGTP